MRTEKAGVTDDVIGSSKGSFTGYDYVGHWFLECKNIFLRDGYFKL